VKLLASELQARRLEAAGNVVPIGRAETPRTP